MSDITAHVTSLELSRKLKKLGVKQDSYFYWADWIEEKPELEGGIECISTDHHFSAYLASELGEMLPKALHNDGYNDSEFMLTIQYNLAECWVSYTSSCGVDITEWIKYASLPRGLALMLIHLIENDLVDDEWRAKWLESV